MITLEYSEEQGAFHNNIGDHEENSNGYKTIGEVSEDKLLGFVLFIKANSVGEKLTFGEVKEIFDLYFEDEP